MKLPKDFGRIKMEEEMQRADTKRRKQEWDEENSTDWEDVAMIVAVSALLAYIIIRSIF